MSTKHQDTGLIHLYCGEGKGKTTCAMGLALRAAGRGIPVVIAQFLKSENTGERTALAAVPGVTLLPLPEQVKFTFRMTEQEKAEEGRRCTERLREAFALAEAQGGLLILDEVCAAISAGMLPQEEVVRRIDQRRPDLELVLTGRDPIPELTDRADYITAFENRRHPYDRGIPAREGIEY